MIGATDADMSGCLVKHTEMCAFIFLITPAQQTLIQDIILHNVLCWSQAEHLDFIYLDKQIFEIE